MSDCKNIFIYIILFLLIVIIFIISIDKYNIYNLNKLLILENLPNLPYEMDVIPNNLFQTYKTKYEIPQYIFDNKKKYASAYKHIVLDDEEALVFLNKYFSNCVLNRFKSLREGCHKADLLRYCLLYIYGGVYLDIKVILIEDMDKIFKNKKYFYSTIGHDNIQIFQGILASHPRNKLFLKLINSIIHSDDDILCNDFHIFIRELYKKLTDDCNKPLIPGLNIGKLNNYYLFNERCSNTISTECSKLDRYKLCCSVYDIDKKIFISRDPNYPWGKNNKIPINLFKYIK